MVLAIITSIPIEAECMLLQSDWSNTHRLYIVPSDPILVRIPHTDGPQIALPNRNLDLHVYFKSENFRIQKLAHPEYWFMLKPGRTAPNSHYCGSGSF